MNEVLAALLTMMIVWIPTGLALRHWIKVARRREKEREEAEKKEQENNQL